ncbi:unnamed protein product [Arctogadus glacialis]
MVIDCWLDGGVGQQIRDPGEAITLHPLLLSVELLQKYHQGIRSEMEARGPQFTDCTDLGRALLGRKHRDSAEIKEKLVLLMETRKEMMLRWDDRWDWLRLLLEVCQFSRDASVAEAWLIAQEPHVASREVGHSVHEVEKLLKRHEAFEKSTASWEERFCALERLTTMELLELRQQQQEMEELRKEQLESERDSRREDTGFVEDSQLLTTERQTLSPSASGALAGEADVDADPSSGVADADPSSGVPDSTVLLLSESLRESGSMELDPPLSAAWEPRAATMPSEGPRAPALLQEGTLGRKHDLEGPGKKASNRSWNSLYCVLKPGQLCVYKDSKSFGHAVTFHGEDPLALDGAGWEPLANYKKKKHVFKLRLRDGGEYLFQCKDEEELQRWGAAMSQAALAQEGAEPADSSGTKAHSLPPPPPSEPPKKDKKAEKKFFSKKK